MYKKTIPTEFAQHTGNVGRESNSNTARCALDSLTLTLLTWTIWRAPTTASKWRMGFNSAFKGLNMFRDFISYFDSMQLSVFLLLNTDGQCTFVQLHLVTVSGSGCTLDRHYLCLKNQSRHSNTEGSSIKYPFYRALGHGSFVVQKPATSGTFCERCNAQQHSAFQNRHALFFLRTVNTLCTWTIR